MKIPALKSSSFAANLVNNSPPNIKSYMQLMRIDKPVGMLVNILQIQGQLN